jgi:predicted peroxiredoxin
MAVDTTNQSILYVASHGMEDSYRATLIFAAAKKLKEDWTAYDVKVALLGEATWLASGTIQDKFSLGEVINPATKTVTRPQLSALIQACVGLGVPIGV